MTTRTDPRSPGESARGPRLADACVAGLDELRGDQRPQRLPDPGLGHRQQHAVHDAGRR